MKFVVLFLLAPALFVSFLYCIVMAFDLKDQVGRLWDAIDYRVFRWRYRRSP